MWVRARVWCGKCRKIPTDQRWLGRKHTKEFSSSGLFNVMVPAVLRRAHLFHRKIICLHSHRLTARYGRCLLSQRWWVLDPFHAVAMKIFHRSENFQPESYFMHKLMWRYYLFYYYVKAAKIRSVRFYYTSHTYLINHGLTISINKLSEVRYEHIFALTLAFTWYCAPSHYFQVRSNQKLTSRWMFVCVRV